MIGPTFPRRLAAALLQSAISIAPADTLDWGRAMLGELWHVEGNWSAFFWSLGSAGVLAKHTLVALIFPSGSRPTIPSGGDLFSREVPMRKPALAIIASCVLASLLFFLAPVFRQAFRISLAQWHYILHIESPANRRDPQLEALAREAEQNHDAEALAFLAVRYPNEVQRTRYADEAVRLNPGFTWVYATAGSYDRRDFGRERVEALLRWDPDNALPHLIAAQQIGQRVTFSKEFPRGKIEPNPGWEEAMATAFQSPKLDTYLDRLKHLDRLVLARYHLNDPLRAPSYSYERWYGLPSYGPWYSSVYAQSLLDSGRTLEARGDVKAAFAQYATIARFGQLIGVDRGYLLRKQLEEAYARLEVLSQKNGNSAQARFYATVADSLDRAWEDLLASWRRPFENDVTRWNAFLVRLSGLLMLFFGGVLVLCFAGVMIRSRSVRLVSLRPSALTLALAFGSAVGVVLSSAFLFASYWPYSYALKRFVSAGDESGLSNLADFVGGAQVPLGAGFRIPERVFYFWSGVAILCALALLFAIVRHLQTRHLPADA